MTIFPKRRKWLQVGYVAILLAGCATSPSAPGCHPAAHIIITADCQTKLCTPIEAVGGFWGGLECRY
jgi:hypothetical protein